MDCLMISRSLRSHRIEFPTGGEWRGLSGSNDHFSAMIGNKKTTCWVNSAMAPAPFPLSRYSSSSSSSISSILALDSFLAPIVTISFLSRLGGQRLYGFAASLVIGFAFMLLSLVVFYKPIKFALLFTFGNLFAVGRRLLNMHTCFHAMQVHSKLLTVIAIVSEICALVWYSLSYVPFARRMVSELLISCCDTEL
ncbi:hypothetical protein ZIOFF_012550 [Zingiber officinale]|uniref:Vesicle transport protein n=1 Tax=Zingiber officinale TaxID=94328 RepID=A0A8J5HLT6_ZINOF|nr:hypothetical protein ZIOFF_012550 [Zingiber officinale]